MRTDAQTLPTISQSVVGVVSLVAWPQRGSLTAPFAALGLDVEALSVSEFDSASPPEMPVVVIAVPAEAHDRTLRSVVEWGRRATLRVGLIGVAPRGGRDDSERALIAGFDDFVAGDVSSRELAGRARALLRRVAGVSGAPRERLVWGRFVLDASRYLLEVGERRVPLTPRELRLLRILIEAGGRTLTRDQLLDRVWGTGELDVQTRAVDSLISRLRHKLGDDDVVATVHGVGFRVGDR